jgi:hypothetical protein
MRRFPFASLTEPLKKKQQELSSQTDKAETKRMGTTAVPRFRIKQGKRERNWS